jgi:hypothetical protein
MLSIFTVTDCVNRSSLYLLEATFWLTNMDYGFIWTSPPQLTGLSRVYRILIDLSDNVQILLLPKIKIMRFCHSVRLSVSESPLLTSECLNQYI